MNNKDNTRWNHAYTIAFSIGQCESSDPDDMLINDPVRVKHLILQRVLSMQDAEVVEACEHYDTYEEPYPEG